MQNEMVDTLTAANGDGLFFISPHNIEIRGTIDDLGSAQDLALKDRMDKKVGTDGLTLASIKEKDIPCKRGGFCNDERCHYLHPVCRFGRLCTNKSCNCHHPKGRINDGVRLKNVDGSDSAEGKRESQRKSTVSRRRPSAMEKSIEPELDVELSPVLGSDI